MPVICHLLCLSLFSKCTISYECRVPLSNLIYGNCTSRCVHFLSSLKALYSSTINARISKQESPADAVKPARRKSMQKLLQFDVFRFISPISISPNCQCIASRGMFRQALGLYCYRLHSLKSGNPVFANYKVFCLNYKYLVYRLFS